MGISERKEREKEELRDLILNAAREIFIKHGYEATSIRKIANKIEYSPGTIYHYFKDKNDMLLALHEKSFDLKIKSLFTTVEHIADPMDRLEAVGFAYLNYALEHPQDYELMFIQNAPMKALAVKKECWKDGAIAIQFLKNILQECVHAKYISPETNIDDLALVLWSQVHGLASLHNTERLNIYEDTDIRQFMFDAYRVFIKMVRVSFK